MPAPRTEYGRSAGEAGFEPLKGAGKILDQVEPAGCDLYRAATLKCGNSWPIVAASLVAERIAKTRGSSTRKW